MTIYQKHPKSAGRFCRTQNGFSSLFANVTQEPSLIPLCPIHILCTASSLHQPKHMTGFG